jgi:hypothetical protein
MVTAWFGLIVLQTVVSQQGSGRVASAMADVNRLVQRALDPRVAAIPDRRAGRPAAAAAPPVDPTARQADGTWPTYNVPSPGHQNWPSFNVPVPR